MDKQTKEGPPRVASSVLYNHEDIPRFTKEEKMIKILDMHELTRERVVSKLMLDMVHLVESIHFDRDGSIHLRNVGGSHDGSMTPDV